MQKALLIQVVVGLMIGGSLGAVMGYFGKCSSGTCPLTANPWRGAFIGAVIGGLFAYSAGGSRLAGEVGEQVSLQIAGAEEFDSLVINADKPVLVDFYSTTCGPCRKLAPTIEKLAKQYQGRAVVSKVNVGKLPELARQYAIQGVPSVLFFQSGKEVGRLVGLQAASDYTEVLDKLIAPGL